MILAVAVLLAAAPASAAYVGAGVCRDCHAEKYERWQDDWHARALSEPNAQSVAGSFDGAHFKGASSEAWLSHQQERYVMRTRDRSGEPRDYAVRWLIGGKRMQDAVTVLGDGRWQVLPVYFHVTGQGAWVDYNEAKQGVVGPDHPFFWTNFRRTANHECLDCHSTGLDVAYDRTRRTWSTSFADAGVACEACHGPGGRHADSKAKSDIVVASKLGAAEATAICARCHGPREPLFPFLDPTHRFTPGARYDDYFQPAGLVDGPDRSGEYFSDGRPSSSSFEWQALLQSRCYQRGGATCLTCHTAPHAEHAGNGLKVADADTSCATCHAALAARATEHSHHTSERCVSCHMPRTLSGVLDKFADHSIDVPVPENTLLHGIPNACATCHAEKSSAELVEAINRWWPESARRARRTRLAAAFDEKSAKQSENALASVVRDRDEAPLLRGFAAELLGQRFPVAAARELPALLNEPDAGLRSKALQGLGAAKAQQAREPVAKLLRDPSLFVRQSAALTLATWNDARGVTALEQLVRERDGGALVRPRIALAQHYANNKRFADAKTQIDAALARMPYLVPALVFSADLAVHASDIAAAVATLEEALRFDPQYKGALGRLQSLRR